MTEPRPAYTAPSIDPAMPRLPRRAWNLAMRILELERECNQRGRVTVEVIFLDGRWLLGVARPMELEQLGD